MDYKGLRFMRQLPLAEVVVMLLVMTLTVFIGLIEAVLVGLMLSCVLFMKHIADIVEHRTKAAPLREFSREVSWTDEGDIINRIGQKVYIKHLDGPLFFGFASRFQEIIKALPEMEVFVVRMDKVPYVDQSGLFSLEDAIVNLRARGIRVVFTDVHGQPLNMLERLSIIPDLVPREFCFPSFQACAQWLYEIFKNGDSVKAGS
jgi:SulP family sulfate permease